MAQRTSVFIYTISTRRNGFPSRKPIQARWATASITSRTANKILQELAEEKPAAAAFFPYP